MRLYNLERDKNNEEKLAESQKPVGQHQVYVNICKMGV